MPEPDPKEVPPGEPQERHEDGPSDPPSTEGRAPVRAGGDRRQSERRSEARDGERRSRLPDRRGGFRPGLAVLWLFFGAAGLSVGWRALVVAPRQAARAEGHRIGEQIGPVLARISIPFLWAPGFGPPVVGDPTASALAIAEDDRKRLVEAEAALTTIDAAVPGQPLVLLRLAPLRFALGQDRLARFAWEQVLACGNPPQRAEAHLGLAAIALRSAFRQREEQDRAFAAEHAMHHLDAVDAAADARRVYLRALAVHLIAVGPERQGAVDALRTTDGGAALAEHFRLDSTLSQFLPKSAPGP